MNTSSYNVLSPYYVLNSILMASHLFIPYKISSREGKYFNHLCLIDEKTVFERQRAQPDIVMPVKSRAGTRTQLHLSPQPKLLAHHGILPP